MMICMAVNVQEIRGQDRRDEAVEMLCFGVAVVYGGPVGDPVGGCAR